MGRFRARLHGVKVRVIGAEEVSQHARVEWIILRPALPKPVAGPVQGLGVHGIDHDAVVKQKIHHPALTPLNRCPQLDPLGPPLVELPAPMAHPLRRMRYRASQDLRPHLIHDPERMRLIRPIDSQVVPHSSSLLALALAAAERERRGWPYTSPPGGYFLLNLWRRSLADRDSQLMSLLGLANRKSSGRQAPGRDARSLFSSALLLGSESLLSQSKIRVGRSIWRIGLDLGAARERVRVARALGRAAAARRRPWRGGSCRTRRSGR